jgi:hypothetical protein
VFGRREEEKGKRKRCVLSRESADEDEEVLFLEREIFAEGVLSGKLGLEVGDVEEESFGFSARFELHLGDPDKAQKRGETEIWISVSSQFRGGRLEPSGSR